MIPSYPSTPHWPESLSVHRDDHYHRDPEWFLNKPVIITEKLDGGLTGIHQGRVYARSSFAPTREPWFDYVKSRTLPKLYGVLPSLIAYGEDLYGVHSIEYDALPDSFFLFHVCDLNGDSLGPNYVGKHVFYDWHSVTTFAQTYGIQTVPVLFEGQFSKVQEITDWFMTNIREPSVLGPSREGFVLRVWDRFVFEDFGKNCCKFVRANHVQTTEHWTKTWKPAQIQK